MKKVTSMYIYYGPEDEDDHHDPEGETWEEVDGPDVCF